MRCCFRPKQWSNRNLVFKNIFAIIRHTTIVQNGKPGFVLLDSSAQPLSSFLGQGFRRQEKVKQNFQSQDSLNTFFANTDSFILSILYCTVFMQLTSQSTAHSPTLEWSPVRMRNVPKLHNFCDLTGTSVSTLGSRSKHPNSDPRLGPEQASHFMY